MSLIKYSIILPAYQEAANLQILLPQLQAIMTRQAAPYEILVIGVVNPLDSTAVICENFGVKYLARAPGQCYGDAVRTGINMAQGQFTIFMDADGSHPPAFLPQLLAEEEKGDVIIASRYMPGGTNKNAYWLIGLSQLLNKIYGLFLKSGIYDISNSLRLYRTQALKSIPLHCQHFDILQEILFTLIKQIPDLKIKEIPFVFEKRRHGKSKRQFIIFGSYFLTLLRLMARKYFAKSKES